MPFFSVDRRFFFFGFLLELFSYPAEFSGGEAGLAPPRSTSCFAFGEFFLGFQQGSELFFSARALNVFSLRFFRSSSFVFFFERRVPARGEDPPFFSPPTT